MFKKLSLFLLIGLLALSLIAAVGCGQAEQAQQPQGEQDGGEQPQPSEEKTTISFAGSGGYPPFNFIDEKTGDVIGFDVEVGEEIAKRLGVELDYVTTAWDGIIEGLRVGHYDGILGSMAIKPEREEVVDFSIPYYYSGAQLIVRKDSGIKGPADLPEDAVIAVATGTTFEEDVQSLGAEVALYEDDNQTLMELLNGHVDGVITDRVVGLNAMQKMNGGDELTLAGSVMREETMAIAFQQEDDELREKVDRILQEMHEDGTLSKISGKWFNGEDITKK